MIKLSDIQYTPKCLANVTTSGRLDPQFYRPADAPLSPSVPIDEKFHLHVSDYPVGYYKPVDTPSTPEQLQETKLSHPIIFGFAAGIAIAALLALLWSRRA